MKSIIFALILILGFGANSLFARDYTPSEVNQLLAKNQGAQLIRPVPLEIKARSELNGLMQAVRWIRKRYQFAKDDDSGYWTSSDAMFTRLSGDCEDWAILFIALARFSSSKPIPPNRIWITGSLTSETAVHAWVYYQDPLGNIFSIDFSKEGLRIILEPDWTSPIFLFNDKTVWTSWAASKEK